MVSKLILPSAQSAAFSLEEEEEEEQEVDHSTARIRVKIGALLEESDHEQVNMFIRTIKMINERRDETIRQLLNISSSSAAAESASTSSNAHTMKKAQAAAPKQQLGFALRQLSEGPKGGETDNEEEKERKEAEEAANADNDKSSGAGSPVGAHLLGGQQALGVKLEPMIEFLGHGQGSFEADGKVCQLIESGILAILGPTDGTSIQHVQSICDNLEIPYFELRPFLGGSPAASAMTSPMAFSPSQPPQFVNQRPPLSRRTDFGQVTNNADGYQNILDPTKEDSESQARTAQSGSAGNRSAVAGDVNADADADGSAAAVTNLHEPGGRRLSLDPADGSQTASSGTGSASRLDLDSVTPPQANRVVPPTSILQQQQQPNRLEDLTLNLYPPTHLLTSAYIDLIYAWNWTSFAIVYEDGNSMIKLQDLFRESSGSWTSKWQIRLFQFNPDRDSINSNVRQEANINSGGQQGQAAPSAASAGTSGLKEKGDGLNSGINPNTTNPNFVSATKHSSPNEATHLHQRHKKRKATFRDIFWDIKLSGEQNILLDVRTENLYEALKQAQQVGCMTERFSYLVTSLDLHTIDLEDFKYSRTRITSFNLIQVARFQQPAYLRQASSSFSTSSDNSSQKNGHNNLTQGSQSAKLSASLADEQPAAISRDDTFSPPVDEKYLKKLGVHVIQSESSGDAEQSKLSSPFRSQNQNGSDYYNHHQSNGKQNGNRLPKYKLSPSVVLDRTGSYMDPPSDAYKDWPRRDQSASLPAATSMNWLPNVNRDNEQRLFEFFVEQQERNLSRVRLSTSSAILHDSLILFALGLNELDPQGRLLGEQHITCSLNSQPWLHGSSLVNYMRRTSFNGLTGSISFDQRGFRSDFKLDMMGVAPDIGLIKVGEWHSRHLGQVKAVRANGRSSGADEKEDTEVDNSADEVSSIKSYDEISEHYERELKRYKKLLADGKKVAVPYTKRMSKNGALLVNDIIFERLYREQLDQVDTLIVTTKLSQPYFMLKETPNKLEGNEQYEGFAVDLVHELSKLVNFKYRWRQVADRKYGSKEVLPNGTIVWNGMIGEIVRGQADLAIVDLTITAQREEAVDFTLPFMNTGISILFKKPTTKVTTLFSFLSPFSSFVWAYVLAAYCGISVVLFFVGHLSPYEWSNPHPCRHITGYGDDVGVLKNQFSLLNSFWFTIGSLMQQGSDLTPRSMSTRTIAGIWYFFTLIMISSYTANLAAFLTVEKVVYPIENVRDLSNQQEIKYGCVESGSTCTFFHDSQIDTYKRINETMRKFKTYVRSNDEGQKRVEEGKFAFFMESASIEYIVERNCNLTQIGGLLDSKGYGMATGKKSRLKRPYRTLLSEGILHLQETGMLHVLKNRWWKERRGGGTCTDDSKGGGVTELSLANVGGVFVVLLGGLGISFLVAIAEFMWRAKRSGSTRDGMCEEMMSDLKFALACKRSTKPVAPKPGAQNLTSAKRRLVHQASSLMASQFAEQLDPCLIERQIQATQSYGAKKCDPILLQAMLTMLAQQQQQDTAYLSSSVDYPANTSAVPLSFGRQSSDNNGPNRFNNVNFSHSMQPAASSKDTFMASEQLSLMNEQAHGNGNQTATRQQHNHHFQHLQPETSSGPQKRASDAGKRRLLFAQQTINTTDESFFARHAD